MKLTFGLSADGRAYPDFPGDGEGVLDEAVVGPAGLTDILELQLGHTGPRAGEAVRVAAFAAKLRASLGDRPRSFFAASFDRDPWATARLLLEWRDQLIESGWAGQAMGQTRLDDLSAVEKAGPLLPAGLADRARTLLAALKAEATLGLSELTTIEPITLLPPVWRSLLEALRTSGIGITSPAAHPPASGSDLGRVQSFLQGGSVTELQGDGSFVLVQADTALLAAESIAEWLAAGSEDDLSGTLVLCPDGDSSLLDQAFISRGLPALGQSAGSRWRGALQILPLAFAVAWKPFNPKALLDLLLLPRPPLSRSAAGRLARALSREPGNGGPAWLAAWADIEADLKARNEGEPKANERTAERLNGWRQWTTGGLYDRRLGIPAADARAIAARVGQWARLADPTASDPLLLALAGAAGALSQTIDAMGLDHLPALLLERMVEQVLAEGAQNPMHIAQAGGLRCVKNSGAIWAPAPRIIWWGFTGPGRKIPQSPWDDAERAALTQAGCEIENPQTAAARLSWGYSHAVHMAGERLIMVRPALSADQENVSHPLAHQLDPVTRPAGDKVRWRAERLLEEAAVELSGRTLPRQPATRARPPQPKTRWVLPQGVIDRLEDRWESATSLEHLVDCQLRWLLLDVVRLSRGRFAEIPGSDQLLGNLAHEIANRVLEPGPVDDPAIVKQKVEAVFDELVSAIAAPLQQPELAGELATARSRIPAALAQLAALLRERDLQVVGAELDRSAELGDGLKVRGRLDLLVTTPTSGPAVIDLKWTRSAKRRRDEIAAGRALQLATYGAIADPSTGKPAPGAYYLLNQRRLIGERGDLLAEEGVEAVRSLPDTWLGVVATWKTWRDFARSGSALATGIPMDPSPIPADLGFPSSDKPCRYCELTALCRVGAVEI